MNRGVAGITNGAGENNFDVIGFSTGTPTAATTYSFGTSGVSRNNTHANIGASGLTEGQGTNYNRAIQGYALGNEDNPTTGINTGVYGLANESTNFNYGVQGATSGQGSYNIGVQGVSNGTSPEGSSSLNIGVWGAASNGSSNAAGYFLGNVTIQGNLGVSGSISKGSGTFKIDHPQDPANKYLVHSFVESPEMMNVYNGNTTTDANGFKTVQLPAYFNKINKDFRYQLTVIGTFAQAIIKEKISGNTFVIQTSEPNVEVSWQVTGVRSDKWANNNRVIPELEKEKKGTYLHPELYNMPKENGEYYLQLDNKQYDKGTLKKQSGGQYSSSTE